MSVHVQNIKYKLGKLLHMHNGVFLDKWKLRNECMVLAIAFKSCKLYQIILL